MEPSVDNVTEGWEEAIMCRQQCDNVRKGEILGGVSEITYGRGRY